ncbi:MAG: PQQ-binding-like beta-propeller repeat protein [Planctomycetota bacterium]
MSDRLLEKDEVDFLLAQSPPPSAGSAGRAAGKSEAPAEREVTMRGDLQKISLSDIFQTLAMSKMEGLLRIQGAIESRDIHFADGYIRCIVPKRMETLRLGQRLARAGLISTDQLRSALVEQKRTRQPLGATLVANGLVTEEEIEDVVANQIQEDLFALFTWQQGSFEFYRGAVGSPELAAQIAATPQFDVNGVLLEVARRSDEWQRIFETVRSLDEIFVLRDGADIADLGDNERAVVEGVERRCTLRELADVTLLGVFECSRLVRELYETGVLRRIAMDEGLTVAEQLLTTGEPRRAALTVQAILDRGEHRLRSTTERAADILARAGDARLASKALIEAADLEPEEDVQLALARRAREICPRSLEVLVYLQGALHRAPQVDPKERFAVTSDLVDELYERGQLDDCLGLVEQLEHDSDDLSLCRPRRARALARLGRNDEAVETLLDYASKLDPKTDVARLTAAYEQILKIDYRRKDAARALRNLQSSRIAIRLRGLVTVAILLGVAFAGYVQFDAWRVTAELSSLDGQVEALLASNDVAGASELYDQAVVRFGERDELVGVAGRIAQARREADAERDRNIEAARDAKLSEATTMFDGGDYKAALDVFFARTQLGIEVNALEDDLKGRMAAVRLGLESFARGLPEKLPPEPTMLQTAGDQAAQLAKLAAEFHTKERRIVEGLVSVREDPRLVASLGTDFPTLFAVVDRLAGIYATADERRIAYEDRVSRRKIAEELTPIYELAVRQENEHDFAAALTAYRRLAAEHPAEDELREHFRRKVLELEDIVTRMADIARRTAAGDRPGSRSALVELSAAHPGLAFDQLVTVPVQIGSTPTDAEVFVDDRNVGRTPLLVAVVAGRPAKLRIARDGYAEHVADLTGQQTDEVDALLERLPRWTAQLTSSVDRRMSAVGDDRLLVIDRAGSILALDAATGSTRWRRDTQDLSGLLTTPAVSKDFGVVGSVDGTLRCLRLSDGEIVWEVDGLACEAAPLLLRAKNREVVLAVGVNGAVRTFDLASGRPGWSENLELPVQCDPILLDGLAVIVASNGRAVGLDIENGEPRWRAEVSAGATLPIAVSGSRLVIAGDDGTLVAIDGLTGSRAWLRDDLASATAAPCADGDRIFVGHGRTLAVLDARSGRTIDTRMFESELRMALANSGPFLFVGQSNGFIHAVDRATLRDAYRIRGDAPAVAPALTVGTDVTVMALQNQTVIAFRGTL